MILFIIIYVIKNMIIVIKKTNNSLHHKKIIEISPQGLKDSQFEANLSTKISILNRLIKRIIFARSFPTFKI